MIMSAKKITQNNVKKIVVFSQSVISKTKELVFSVVAKIKAQYAQTKQNVKDSYPKHKAHVLTKLRAFKVWLLDLNIMPVFVFFASFFFIDIDWKIRAIASIGIYYAYKEFVLDVLRVRGSQ